MEKSTCFVIKTSFEQADGSDPGGSAEPNLRMWFHFYVILGDEAVFPIELCLVPVLITFFIQNLKRIINHSMKHLVSHYKVPGSS